MIFKLIKVLENRVIEPVYRSLKKRQNHNTDFTIFSNDCWGGGIYEELNLKYLTPTVGLFFYSPCYIKLIQNFQVYMSKEITFIKKSKYNIGSVAYPIGLIDDVEIHFLHYKNEKEARDNWNRRKARINYSNLYFKFSDLNLCTPELALEFDNLDFKNKIFFYANEHYKNIKCGVRLKRYRSKKSIGDIYTNKWGYRFDFDPVKWLNKNDVLNNVS